MFFKRRKEPSKQPHRVVSSCGENLSKFPKNIQSTTKYTWYSFLPLNLFQQFWTNVANIYFLMLVVFNAFSIFGVTSVISNALPLAFVVIVSMVKDCFEDLRRWRDDVRVNSASCHLGDGTKTKWQDIKPGNILLIQPGEFIPADVIILTTTQENGIVYVETQNLDGETSLKRRNAVLVEFDGYTEANVTGDDGFIIYQGQEFTVSKANALHKGTRLRGQHSVIALVTYTGKESVWGMIQSSQKQRRKQSVVATKVNWTVGVNLFLLFALCLVTAVLSSQSYKDHWKNGFSRTHFEYPDLGFVADGAIVFVCNMILLSTLVPISLYVSIEIVRSGQAGFIGGDVLMGMYKGKNWIPTLVRDWSLADSLGAIDIICSDKTGTMTKNEMTLRMIVTDRVHQVNGISSKISKFSTATPETVGPASDLLWTCLSLCHSCSVDDTGRIISPSPLELTFLTTASHYGVGYKGMSFHTNLITLSNGNEYTLLHSFEFSSARKRMSVVVRDHQDGNIWIICKGADSIILPRCANNTAEFSDALEDFAGNHGLRTLCVSRRMVPESEYQQWKQQWDQSEEHEELMDELEVNLEMVGGTGVEDLLQDGVPEALSLLRRGGISVWMLTGDKLSTACNIGYSSGLLTNDMNLFVVHSAQDMDTFDESYDAIVMDGDVMVSLDQDQFVQCALKCKSVVISRCAPSQKSTCVEKLKTLRIVLSIGDGANDTPMIGVAHVGVALTNTPAANSADYTIPEFSFLARLLLVHGKWNHMRMISLVEGFFYNNIIFTIPLWFYGGWPTSWDSTQMYEPTYLTLYNLVFTALPVIFTAVFDQDVSADQCLEFPELYIQGRKKSLLGRVWFYMTVGLFHAVVCFFIPYGIYQKSYVNTLDLDHRYYLGMFVASAVVFSANCATLLRQYRWDWFTSLWAVISALTVFFWNIVYTSSTSAGEYYNSGWRIMGTSTYWACVMLCWCICLGSQVLINTVSRFYYYKDVDIVREVISIHGDDSSIETDHISVLPKE